MACELLRISCDTPAFAIAELKLCRKLWKAQAGVCPAFRRVARDLPFNARARHDSRKLAAQAALAARAFASKRRKQKRLADAGRFQQVPLKLRVKRYCNRAFSSCLA